MGQIMPKEGHMSRLGQQPEPVARRRTWPGLLIALSVVAIGLFGWQWWIGRMKPPAVSAERIAEQHSKGPDAAEVTIIEYGDFDCPTCKAFFDSGVLDHVLNDYPDQVRLVFRHLPIITPVSPKLAEASECAADQGAFWAFHDLLYKRAPTQPSQMPDLARALGLDLPGFTACLDSGRYASLVQSEIEEGSRYGFHATPSFLINGEPLIGPPSYDQLKKRIDAALQPS
jgi:protein-disulfide isomerase